MLMLLNCVVYCAALAGGRLLICNVVVLVLVLVLWFDLVVTGDATCFPRLVMSRAPIT